jgi:RNA recognition motif-containing protein
VFVGNLSLDMTETELKQEFVPYGEILSAHIMNDKYIGSRQPQGYGFVSMAKRSQGEAAIIGLNGKMLQNHTVNVLEALPLSPVRSSISTKRNYRQRR